MVLESMLLCAVSLSSNGQTASKVDPPTTSQKEQDPPEEDESFLSNQHYSFNPLQSRKELEVGKHYFKSRKYKAAAGRFREATKWDDANAEAWLLLGKAMEQLHDVGSAKVAYLKYLGLTPAAKDAPKIQKRLKNLK